MEFQLISLKLETIKGQLFYFFMVILKTDVAYSSVMALLKENYHILSLDMPGVGKSSQLFQ
ncbi:MAG: hypothetical protein CVV28_05060 [Methanobacteriales archaeon HGW-Methanobacteriales-1]|nr:MAG: hypothetical protein CVV28_05060 [Methanobacteriales archaeon HGW-Methanobacteriales-1]PKP12802.1 MAG: hypothetical protein CVU08_08735 [Bacteroidetes bacterium HGW-Bacteroidetes-3]